MNKKDLMDNANQYYNKTQLDLLEKAIDFATKAHLQQKRASGEPYIIHPLFTADTLISWGMDIDSVIAGILHDTIEDTDTTIENINDLFGSDIALLVDGVTKVSKTSSDMKNLENYSSNNRHE